MKSKRLDQMYYENCIEFSNNKSKTYNEFNKTKYHTDAKFQAGRLYYKKQLQKIYQNIMETSGHGENMA